MDDIKQVINLDNMTPRQKAIANRFIDALLKGDPVSCIEFPDVDEDEFTAIADAICLQLEQKGTLH